MKTVTKVTRDVIKSSVCFSFFNLPFLALYQVGLLAFQPINHLIICRREVYWNVYRELPRRQILEGVFYEKTDGHNLNGAANCRLPEITAKRGESAGLEFYANRRSCAGSTG